MKFTVVALSTVPDTVTTRRLFHLEDLDDKAVSKVLFHRRKQQTGSSEVLRWDQRAMASLALIEHSPEGVVIRSMHQGDASELDMLHAYYEAILRHGRPVSWEARLDDLPLLRFRSLMYQVSYPAYWAGIDSGEVSHLDLCDWLSPAAEDRPTLDKTARKLGFPGMLGNNEDQVQAAWLAGDHHKVQAYSDTLAFNSYLIALQLLQMRGELAQGETARGVSALRQALAGKDDQPHRADFLAAWGLA